MSASNDIWRVTVKRSGQQHELSSKTLLQTLRKARHVVNKAPIQYSPHKGLVRGFKFSKPHWEALDLLNIDLMGISWNTEGAVNHRVFNTISSTEKRLQILADLVTGLMQGQDIPAAGEDPAKRDAHRKEAMRAMGIQRVSHEATRIKLNGADTAKATGVLVSTDANATKKAAIESVSPTFEVAPGASHDIAPVATGHIGNVLSDLMVKEAPQPRLEDQTASKTKTCRLTPRGTKRVMPEFILVHQEILTKGTSLKSLHGNYATENKDLAPISYPHFHRKYKEFLSAHTPDNAASG